MEQVHTLDGGKHPYSHIIWDWNGTLLNDVSWCIAQINHMLEDRNLPLLESVSAYQQVFGFPVQEYYQKLGFDFTREPFEDLSLEYMDLYHGPGNHFALYPAAPAVLKTIAQSGIRQVILSASKKEHLFSQLHPFAIQEYFEEVLGLSDIYAASKVHVGQEYIRRVQPRKALLVGDTLHDKEVADALSADCVLIAAGHQSRQRLAATGVPVLESISELPNFLGLS